MQYNEQESVLVEELRVTQEQLLAQAEELEQQQFLAAQERERYRLLFDKAPVPYLVTDRHGTIREANRAAAALLRCPSDRLIGKPLTVFVAPDARPHFRRELMRLDATDEAMEISVTLLSRDGAPHLMDGTAEAMHDRHGNLVEIRWLLRAGPRAPSVYEPRSDRSDARRAVTTTRSGRRLAGVDLVSWVSHELRTPAASIGGYADLLALGLRGPLTPDQQALLVRIQQAQSHLVSLLDDLLLLSRLDAGSLQLEMETVALTPVLERVQILLEPQAIARDVRLTFDTDHAQSVVGDPHRVLQILLNLTGNAVKFTPPGTSVDVTVRAEDNRVLVHVWDCGAGVPEDMRESVFQPYVQIGGGMSPRSNGAGLGLAISRDLARAMSGDVYCDSGANGGSVFVLSLRRVTGHVLR